MPQLPIKLTPEELAVITMTRRNTFQSICVQVQDSVITSVDQTLKFRRKKGGGLVTGMLNRAAVAKSKVLKFSKEEIAVIKMIRDRPFQKITFNIVDGSIDGLEQTLKFRKLKS
jgi:hypothetical protein